MNADAAVLNKAKPGIEIKEPCHTLGEPSFRVVDFPRLTLDDVKSVYANLLIKKFLRNVESYNPDPAVRTEVALQNIDELMAIYINARMARSGNQWHSFKIVIYNLYGRQITLEEALTEVRHLKPPISEGGEECLEEFLVKYECLSQMVRELPPVELAFKIKVFEALPDELQSYFDILLVSGNVTIKDFINLVQEKLKVYHTSKTKRSGQQGSSGKKC